MLDADGLSNPVLGQMHHGGRRSMGRLARGTGRTGHHEGTVGRAVGALMTRRREGWGLEPVQPGQPMNAPPMFGDWLVRRTGRHPT
jgi:hypothetical protein